MHFKKLNWYKAGAKNCPSFQAEVQIQSPK